jgi:hypothetical protein
VKNCGNFQFLPSSATCTILVVWPFKQRRSKESEPVSMVLLHQYPRRYRVGEIQSAVQRAWPVSMNDAARSAPVVTVSDEKVILHVDGHLIVMFSVGEPYFGKKSVEFSNRLQNPIQKELWARHVAWTAVDYMGGGSDIEEQFSVLANLVADLLDSECLGVYVPSESSLIPNNTELYAELKKIAASRGINTQRAEI